MTREEFLVAFERKARSATWHLYHGNMIRTAIPSPHCCPISFMKDVPSGAFEDVARELNLLDAAYTIAITSDNKTNSKLFDHELRVRLLSITGLTE